MDCGGPAPRAPASPIAYEPFSAAGFRFGSFSKAWSAVKNTGVNPGAKAVAQGVLSLINEFALALQASRRTSYKTLRGAVGTIANEFEAQAGLHLMKNEGRALIGVGVFIKVVQL